ncbi:MAG: transposase family protein [Bacteroidales bacterium]|nr:transposase family protein [Bacteroidales bacterium]
MPIIKFTTHTRQTIVQTKLKRKESCKIHQISRSWDYELRKREEKGESLGHRSCRPKNIREKSRPDFLTDNFLEEQRKRNRNPGYQRLYLQLKNDFPEEVFTERDIRKIYKKNEWMKVKKKEDPQRYEKENPGDMAHTDLKYLPKIENSETGKKERTYFQDFVDDSTRVTCVSILFDKTAESARTGLVNSYDKMGIKFERMLNDNGAEVTYNNLPHNRRPKNKIHPVAEFCRERGIRQKHTRPMRPQTNGKSERLHRTLDMEVLSLETFSSIEEMTSAIEKWLKWYNEERVHMALRMTPLQKMKKLMPGYKPPNSYLTVLNF